MDINYKMFNKLIYKMKKDFENALLYYKNNNIDIDKALELNPNDSNVYVMRGIMRSELGDNDGALADFEYALKLNPKNSSAYSMRACIKIAQGDLKSANEDLEIANNLLEEEEITESK